MFTFKNYLLHNGKPVLLPYNELVGSRTVHKRINVERNKVTLMQNGDHIYVYMNGLNGVEPSS